MTKGNAAGAARFPPAVLRAGDIPARQRGNGASTIPLVTRAVGAEVFLSGITIFEPGASIPLHLHNCAESVVILSGHASAEIDGTAHHLERYDATYVPAGVPHRFQNASDSEPMRILWTYASVDATRTIIETGRTNRVDAEQLDDRRRSAPYEQARHDEIEHAGGAGRAAGAGVDAPQERDQE